MKARLDFYLVKRSNCLCSPLNNPKWVISCTDFIVLKPKLTFRGAVHWQPYFPTQKRQARVKPRNLVTFRIKVATGNNMAANAASPPPTPRDKMHPPLTRDPESTRCVRTRREAVHLWHDQKNKKQKKQKGWAGNKIDWMGKCFTIYAMSSSLTNSEVSSSYWNPLCPTPPPPLPQRLVPAVVVFVAATVEDETEELPLRRPLPLLICWADSEGCCGGDEEDGLKIDEVAINFSMYCPRIWFSERRFTFSSFTESTRWERSAKVCCSSSTCVEWRETVVLVRPSQARIKPLSKKGEKI